ncbi:RNA-directed DNA polymerase [Caballeronia calidae]|uniref:RNA-directed DNA polymerase n=2 Tax=Caballeronia calidae TaxID=1777139 RepID=A0A158EKC3_9BURK|nr:RNA-directed DNA polymerase [Caballeronia calidae]
MGKRPAAVESFVGNMDSIQRELRSFMQREESPAMETGLERIAAKARCEPALRFTSLAHYITQDRVWTNLWKIPNHSAAGVDGQTVAEAKESFDDWIEPMLQSVHRRGYQAPNIRRVYIPKPGKQEMRPLGVPTVADRALQRSTAEVLSAIYEQDFLPCSFGGRPERSAHKALATLNEVIAGGKVSWVMEADLKNFFGSLDHSWILRFVEHRVGDPRLISLIRRWLKAGILEDGKVHQNEEGTPQGGSISVLLSNVYLHYVLDLWFERVVKRHLQGEAYLVRYIDDFVMCFQNQSDALRVQDALRKRLEKFGLALEPTKTKLVAFGRFAQRYASHHGKRRPETIYFLGFTLYCTCNLKGNFKIGMRTEKSRLRRSLASLQDLMRQVRHLSIREQAEKLNRVLRGHYAYYGIAGNFRALQTVHRAVERYWRKMLSSRSRSGGITWEAFQEIKKRFPLMRPKLHLPYRALQAIAVL